MTVCKTCSGPLGRGNKTGFCRRHVAAHNLSQPHIRERQRAGIKRKHAADPVFLDGLRRRARALGDDPDINARRTRHLKEGEYYKRGLVAMRAPEIRSRAGRKSAATKLAWCPPHLRAGYLHLIYIKRFPAVEARALIEDQNEVEMRRWRASVGAPA